MRDILIFVVFIFCLVLFQFLSPPTVDEIISKYLAARGGKEKLQSLLSVYMEGTRELLGSNMEVQITKIQGTYSKTNFKIEDKEGFSVITKKTGWRLLPGETVPVKMEERELRMSFDQLDIAGPLVDYKLKGYKAEFAGKEEVNGIVCHKLILTGPGGRESDFFIEVKSSLLLQSRQTQKNPSNNSVATITITYSDYREYDGIMMPMKIFTEGIGQGSGMMVLDKIIINPEIDINPEEFS